LQGTAGRYDGTLGHTIARKPAHRVSYVRWCQAAGITLAQQQPSFRRNLENLGFTVRHGNRGAKVVGLRPRAHP